MSSDDKEDSRHFEDQSSSELKLEKIEEEVALKRPRLTGTTLNIVLGFVAGTGFTLFGYANLQCSLDELGF